MKKTLYYKIPLIAVILLFSLTQNSKSQDQPDVDNYMFFLPFINPAASGSYSNLSCAIYGRKQWFSIEGSPTRYGVEVVQPFEKYTISGLLTQESIGVHSKQKLFGTYTYGIYFDKTQHLIFGIGGGAILLKSDYSKVHTTDGSDIQFSGTKTIFRPDFNFGIFYYTKNYNVGFSIPGMIHNTIIENQGDLHGKSSIALTYWQYYLHGGYDYKLNREYSFSTSSLVKIATNAPVDIDLNLQLQYLNLFGGGISYRTKSEIIFFGNIQLNEMFRICYSYHSYFNIKGRYLSGHEIILTFNTSKSKPAVIQNPRF